jgi:hypothetical protein
MKKILWTLLLIFSVSLPANSQPALTPMVGKAFADNNGASAIRMGMGLNNVYRDRWGFYYTYEYRSNIMFFENTAYGKNEYRRDVAGISCKVHPNFMVYGGVGLFMDGILKGQLQSKGGGIPWVIKPVGLRKEIGITYQPNDLPIQISAGYSMSIGFTSNLSWRIPLKPDRMTMHQAITQD